MQYIYVEHNLYYMYDLHVYYMCMKYICNTPKHTHVMWRRDVGHVSELGCMYGRPSVIECDIPM